ncbi:MAG TPA: hypothetical protein DCS15_02350 [Flavobacteriales bacterium]|nr:hypothetical protein [Flavobacteriales bacterium]
MKQSILFILSFCLAHLTFAQAAGENKEAFSLDEALSFAKNNSYNIRIGELNSDRAHQEVINTQAMGLPQIQASGSFQQFLDIPIQLVPGEFFGAPAGELVEVQFGTEFSSSYGLSANQLIFDGRYIYGLKASKAYANYIQVENDKIGRDVEDQVLMSYYSALAAQKNLEILKESNKNIDKSLSETKAFFAEGFVEELDVDQLKLMQSTIESSLKDAENRVQSSLSGLKLSMGYPVDKEIELTDELEAVLNINQAQGLLSETVNTEKHLDMKLVNQGIELQNIGLRVEQSNYAPTLRAFFSHQQNNFGNELDFSTWFPNTVWGVNLNVPLFTSFGTRSKVQMNKIDIDKMEIQKKQLDQSIRLQASNSRSDFYNSLSQYNNEKKNLELAEKIRNKTSIKFKEGMASSLELTQAETQLIQTQGRYIGAMYNLLSAKIKLEQALGQ